MWLEAVLTTDDLAQVLRQFAPLEIRLGDEGSLLLDEPSEVSLLADRGLRVVCIAKLRWPLLGMVIPVGLRSLAVVVVPVVEERSEGRSLVFRIHVEHIDVSLVPTAIDDKITTRVNEELAKNQVSLAWPFLRTLSHTFALPATLASTASIALLATSGSLRISENAIRFAVAFDTAVQRRTGEPPSSGQPNERERAGEVPHESAQRGVR